MANPYKIGVELAMLSNHAQVLGALSHSLLGVTPLVSQLTGHFDKLKLAIGGALGIRPRPEKQRAGGVCPQVVPRISPWRRDRLGNLWRTITGVAAPAEIVAPMQAAGRAGGLATNVVEAEMEAA